MRAAAPARRREERVRLDGQPRAAHPGHQHRRLHRDARGRLRGRADPRAAAPAGRDRAQRRAADRHVPATCSPWPASTPATRSGSAAPSTSRDARGPRPRTRCGPCWSRGTSTSTSGCPTSRSPSSATRGQLERVLINLLSNAVKFTEDGGRITVHARDRRRRGQADGRRHRHRHPRARSRASCSRSSSAPPPPRTARSRAPASGCRSSPRSWPPTVAGSTSGRRTWRAPRSRAAAADAAPVTSGVHDRLTRRSRP